MQSTGPAGRRSSELGFNAVSTRLTDKHFLLCLQAQLESVAGKGSALPLVADVLDRASLERARDTMVEAYGGIHILVNCAGGNQKGATVMPDQSFFDAPLDAFDKVSCYCDAFAWLCLRASVLV